MGVLEKLCFVIVWPFAFYANLFEQGILEWVFTTTIALVLIELVWVLCNSTVVAVAFGIVLTPYIILTIAAFFE